MTELLPLEPAGLVPMVLGFAVDEHSRRMMSIAAAANGWLNPDIRAGGLDAVHEHVAATSAPDLLLIDLSQSESVLGAIDALAEVCAAETRVLAIGARNDVNLYRDLMLLGISDYLLKPLDERQLAATMQRVMAGQRAAVRLQTLRGGILAFIGARGGCGTTSIALSAAAHLAQGGKRVLFFDADLQMGSAALDIDCETSPGLAALLRSPDRVDQALLNAALKPHALGFSLLSALEPVEQQLSVQPEAVQALLSELAALSEAVVVDLPRRLDRASRATLRTADRVVLVSPMTLAGLRETQRLRTFLSGLRAGQHPVVVVNRQGESGADVSRGDFERGIGAPIDILLPFVPQAAAQASEKATVLGNVKGSQPLAKGLGQLARLLGSRPVPPPDSSASDVFRRLLRMVRR